MKTGEYLVTCESTKLRVSAVGRLRPTIGDAVFCLNGRAGKTNHRCPLSVYCNRDCAVVAAEVRSLDGVVADQFAVVRPRLTLDGSQFFNN